MKNIDLFIYIGWGVIAVLLLDILRHDTDPLNVTAFFCFAIFMVMLFERKRRDYPKYMLPYFMRKGLRKKE